MDTAIALECEGLPRSRVDKHVEATDFVDRWHFSTTEYAPAAELVQNIDNSGAAHRSGETAEAELALERHVDQDETWVSIGPGPERSQVLEISVESATRLHRVLGDVLRRL